MPNPAVQGLQLHSVPAVHRVSVAATTDCPGPERPDKKESSWQAVYYHTERPHHGYRNLGKRLIETVNAYLETVRQEV